MGDAASHIFRTDNGWLCSICLESFKKKFNCFRHFKLKHCCQKSDGDEVYQSHLKKKFIGAAASNTIQEDTSDESRIDQHEAYSDSEPSDILPYIERASADERTHESDYKKISPEESDSKGSQNGSSDESVYEEASNSEDEDLLFHENSAKSSITIKDHASILAYSIRHNISQQAIKDLLCVISAHLPTPNRSMQNLSALKRCFGSTETERGVYHEYCSACCKTWEERAPKCCP